MVILCGLWVGFVGMLGLCGWWVRGSVDGGCHKLSENIWFVWSKTSYSGDKWRCHQGGTDGQPTRKDRATQLLNRETLSFAIEVLLLPFEVDPLCRICLNFTALMAHKACNCHCWYRRMRTLLLSLSIPLLFTSFPSSRAGKNLLSSMGGRQFLGSRHFGPWTIGPRTFGTRERNLQMTYIPQ